MILPDSKFWEVFKSTHGAFSTPEAIALINICAQAPAGEYLELGTHKGKSTLAACFALQAGLFNLVDPIFEDDNVCKEIAATFTRYPSIHIEKKLFADISENVIPKFNDLAYVFVDSGDHGEELVRTELDLLDGRVMSGGIIAFHDLDNQFTAVRRGYDRLVGSGQYDPIPVNWSEIFDYVRANNLEEGNSSWHERGSEEFPKFVGAVRKK